MGSKRWLMCVSLAAVLAGGVSAQNPPSQPPPNETDRERRERERRAEKERDALHQKQTRDGLAGRQLDDSGGRTAARQQMETSLLTVSDIGETERGIVVPLDSTIFEEGTADIREAARGRIEKIGGILAGRPNARFRVLGYTDPADSEEQRRIAEQRAQAIRDLLVAAGVSGGQVSTSSVRETRAVTSSDTTTGRQRNRRVEIVVVDPGTRTARP